LTFEDHLVSLLREHTKPLTASRGSMTRAQFIEADGPRGRPDQQAVLRAGEGRPQPVARPDYPDAKPPGESGFDKNAKLQDQGPVRQPRRRSANLDCARASPTRKTPPPARSWRCSSPGSASRASEIVKNPHSVYSGVFQADPKNIPMDDTEQQARYFLKGGKGFQAGGAIKAPRDHPDWSAGTIAYHVEGDRSNFGSDAAAEQFYQQHHDEAKAIAAAWNKGTRPAPTRCCASSSFSSAAAWPASASPAGTRRSGSPRRSTGGSSSSAASRCSSATTG
jgi:hypothetical protein